MSVVVSLRLPEPLWQRLSDEAEAHRRPLAEHIRQQLAAKAELVDELAALRAAFAPMAGLESVVAETLAELRDAAGGDREAMSPPAWGVMVETLILLRSIAGPGKSTPAQSIVKTAGLPAAIRRRPSGNFPGATMSAM